MHPRQSRYAPATTPHDRKPVRGSLIWWLRFLGIVAFFIILLQLPKNQDVHLARIDLRWLGLCMLLTIGQLLLDAFVWHWLLVMQRIRHPYPKTLVAYLASQYLGLVTPGHVGEYLAAGYISMETGITFGYALSSVVVKRILAWVIVAGFGVWGLDLFGRLPRLEGMQWMVLTTFVVLLILAAAITIWVVSLRHLAKKWKKLSPWQIDMTEFWAGMHGLLSPRLLVPFAIAALAFALLFMQLDAVLHALGITLPLVQVSKIVAFSRVVGRLIPLSVVGFGSKDAAMIEMLAQHGIDPTVGLTVTLVLLLCSYLVTLLLSGLCWWIKPLVIRRAGRSSS